MELEAFVAEYDGLSSALLVRGEELRQQLIVWLGQVLDLKVHSVTVRLKSRESLLRKLARPDKSYSDLWDITDLIGLRVITYFEDGVDRVGHVVESKLPVTFEHSVDKRRRKDANTFGYRSLHYVCRLGDGFPPRACFEVQVRTVLEHAWAEIEHDLGYKARDAVPISTRRRLNRLAGLLELADQEFGMIRRELDEYAETLPKRIASAETVQLDRLSLGALLECEEVFELDGAIARCLEKELGHDPFFPAYLLKMLGASGIQTVSEARAGIAQHREAILGMVQPYFAFAFRAWRLSPDRMPKVFRGYSLFFLAHAAVLEASALDIDKVERLAHLYRELDYPDDAKAALTVASMLVEAFSRPGGPFGPRDASSR
jgi:putative GTP pyrophosphokinase